MQDEQVCQTEFVDGSMRPVYETPEHRQYVLDDDGEPVYGVWFIPPDVDSPVIVDDAEF
jgi:hypothetical protein